MDTEPGLNQAERFTRIAGFAGLVFVAIIAAATVIQGATSRPLQDAALEDVHAYYLDHAGVITAVSVIAPFAWVSLALFAAGVFVYTRGQSGLVQGWAVVGLMGVVMQNATFVAVIVTDAVLLAMVDAGDGPGAIRGMWALHSGFFTINAAALTIALGGFSAAILASGLAPRWFGFTGLAAAVLMFSNAVQAVPAVDGTLFPYAFLLGFVAWLLWVPALGIRMLSRPTADASPAAEPTPAPAA